MTRPGIDFAAMRADRAELVAVLEAAGAVFRGDDCRCPFHEDKTASAGVYQGDDGGWRFKCQAASCGVAGDVLDLRARLGGTDRAAEIRKLADAAPGAKAAPKPADTPPPREYATIEALAAAAERSDREAGGKLVKVHAYRKAADAPPYLLVLRIERVDGSKTFRQASTTASGTFVLAAPPKPWPLFSLPRVQQAETVIVCEGEKAAGALHRAGFVATTNCGGALKAEHTDWTPLSGKRVWLWPDADPVNPKTGRRGGIEHMQQVAAVLQALPTPPVELRWIDPDALDLPPKGDAADFCERHGADSGDLLAEVLRQARTLGPLAELEAVLDDAKSGRRFAVPLPWPMLSRESRALLPGTGTILLGPPGSVKSFALLQALAHWTAEGHKAAALELEDGTAYHLRRALAQAARDSNLLDDDWCREHGDEVDAAREACRETLNALQPCIQALPDGTRPTAEAFNLWITRQCEAGCRIVCVDPITLMQKGRATWTDDEAFLFEAKKTIERYGASLVLISHPRRLPAGGRSGPPTMDDLAGGAAYSRFAQTILHLRAHKLRCESVSTSAGIVTHEFNRTVSVLKARNGRGVEGHSFACRFDGGTLALSELGRIEAEQ